MSPNQDGGVGSVEGSAVGCEGCAKDKQTTVELELGALDGGSIGCFAERVGGCCRSSAKSNQRFEGDMVKTKRSRWCDEWRVRWWHREILRVKGKRWERDSEGWGRNYLLPHDHSSRFGHHGWGLHQSGGEGGALVQLNMEMGKRTLGSRHWSGREHLHGQNWQPSSIAENHIPLRVLLRC